MDFLILLLYLSGLFFNFSAVLGMLRLPDIYCRLHSSSKNTTLGSLLIAAGLALRVMQGDGGPAVLKILLIAGLLLVVTPIGSHALARAAYKHGTPLWERSVVDQYAEAPRPEIEDVPDR